MRVERTEDLPGMLDEAFAAGKPVIMEVPVDYSENIKLTEKLGKLVCPI
jgi:acetolactate synthase-1/2/3 large subunit